MPNVTDTEINNPTGYRKLAALDKGRLVDALVAAGVIYPTRRGLWRLPKSELIETLLHAKATARCNEAERVGR